MPKICYVEKNFRVASLDLIEKVNGVVEEYKAQGYNLTLRQLYYQLVARGYIPNNMKSYKNVGSLINDARLAGLIDWDAIEDRTRNLKRLPHWDSPETIIRACAEQYRQDWWRNQLYYVEVWVEKEALANVVERVTNSLSVPYFCCRGYVSQSEMWSAAQRFSQLQRYGGKHIVLLHLGDHDPSGIDMSRDIQERLTLFGVREDLFKFERIALNMGQIKQFNPPPNPAKTTDSRYEGYIDQYGEESWELDALEPQVIHDLITDKVSEYNDPDEERRVKIKVASERQVMEDIADDWDNVYDQYTN